MVQKYKNESATIYYYGKSPKTLRKTPKNTLFTSPDPRSRFKNDTVVYINISHFFAAKNLCEMDL